MDNIETTLNTSRRELLDMGLRGNTLLHFRIGAKNLEVVDEISSEVFKILVAQQKAMSFIPVPDALVDEDDKVDDSLPLPEILEEKHGSDRHTDTRLQTKLTADSLDKKLLRISNEADALFQEQGVDILYLALGFLSWFEDPNSTTPREAPLVLVPVSLERSSAKTRFKLAYTGADLGPNLTLAAKLKSEFQLTLPAFGEELDIDAYLGEVADNIKNQPRWQIKKDDIALGFFSFGKFQMYQDLDPDNWPENKKPQDHSVLQGLLGKGFGNGSEGQYGGYNGHSGQSTPELTELHFVKDADSSQTEAVMAVKQDSNLVIQGPPGTGKSQTITNIISESLADGKTVLFVAEKMAALEVVKRRLDECHLGDAVLELHSHKSNKRTVVKELERTLELGAPQVGNRSAEKRQHIHLRKQLDAYCHQVNQPVLASGTSYIAALGHHLKLKHEAGEHELPELDFSAFRHWDKNAFLEACAQVRELVNHLEDMGVPSRHPFAQSTLEHFSPIEQDQVVTRLVETLELLRRCQESSIALAQEMGLESPENLADIEAICRAAKRALDAPHLKDIALTAGDWRQPRQIKTLLIAGAKMAELQTRRGEQLIDQAWKADLLGARQAWATTGQRWWRFLSSDFRQARRTLQGLLKGNLPRDTEECVALIDDILRYQTLSDQYASHERLGERLFGAQWQGTSSDWQVLNPLSDWVIELYQEVGRGAIPEGLLPFLEGGPGLSGWEERLDELNNATEDLKELIADVCQRLASNLLGVQNIGEQPLARLEEEISRWRGRIDSLYQMTRYNRLRKKLCANKLEQIDGLAYDWRPPPALLLTTLKKNWYEGLVNEASRENEALRQFDRIAHEHIIHKFKRLDTELFHHAQETLVLKHHDNLPSRNAAGEMAIIRHEMNKKRRHLPIRRLIDQAGRAIQRIKPVFMMSPMSVATYLKQRALEFDLVVFDEASQVKVVDALVPILRGKQVVVVGDTRQMPPTDFFGKALELEDEEAEASQTADIESILGMFLSQGAPESMLRWHYRSRHDSLITVSNKEFYDGRLMVFPSPGVNPDARGLKFRHISESVYERGGSRTNPIEARAVAEAVMAHAKARPRLTLGVVAFSTAQRDCILLEVERLRREDPSCEEFFHPGVLEGFFVKNLENVQGDERDVIYISIGYGRTSAGNVTGSFGPVNREGGERRLNVLITRARLAMEVFCNFTADDMETRSDSPFGVRALKSFLRYAETGELETRRESGKETDSPFEDEVSSAIRKLGYEAEPQVGSAGFYIDLAVKDPDKPGRYILAVECDGASYHSSATARDRDRLRQSVLEGLGWRFHRIWSTDWFRYPDKETERLKDAIEQALQFCKEKDLEASGESNPDELRTGGAETTRIERTGIVKNDAVKAAAYIVASGNLGIPDATEIHELELDQVAASLLKVLDIEGPIHIKEAARRLAESAGFSRVGARILQHVKAAARHGQNAGMLHVEGDFLFKDRDKQVKVRDRFNLPAAIKKIELVPEEEIQKALFAVIGAAFSLSEEDAISEALAMMGFQRATANAKRRVGSVLQVLLGEERLKAENSKLRLCSNSDPG